MLRRDDSCLFLGTILGCAVLVPCVSYDRLRTYGIHHTSHEYFLRLGSSPVYVQKLTGTMKHFKAGQTLSDSLASRRNRCGRDESTRSPRVDDTA